MSSQPSKLAIFKSHEFSVCQAAQTRWNSFCPARRYHTSLRQATDSPAENDNNYSRAGRQRAREKLADKEFFLSLLSSAATKREARSYLSRFPSTPNKKLSASQATTNKLIAETEKPGVNLGTFYGVTRSVQDTPVFRQIDTPELERRASFDETPHVALVKLTTPQFLDDETIDGVALTLTQLMRLGMASCVVVDPGPTKEESSAKSIAICQADRLSAAIDACDGGKSWRLDSLFISKDRDTILPKVNSRNMLLKPLRNSNTLIITPLVYSELACKTSLVPANDAILALTRELAGLERDHDPDEDPVITAQKFEDLQKEVALDRLIVLDSRGGIPSFNRQQAAHIFINMEQEFDDIEEELASMMTLNKPIETTGYGPSTNSVIANSNPISKFLSSEIGQTPTQQRQEQQGSEAVVSPVKGHLENLQLLKQGLELLPPSASGIITTPIDVAYSARPPQQDTLSVSRVGTRRQRNPLIHNLLTDKPLHSSSLPSIRLGSNKTGGEVLPPLVQSTFIKRGMPLTILPDPRIAPWTPDNNGEPRITLNDPRIDLPRLVHLIEDSFNRKVDVQDYLERINDRIAGLIIAGEYEGGAILTWETPPDIPDSERYRPENITRLVPYLDKFAVLKRSQGAGGVADIVFNAMVRSCLPQGVCWRSRKDNPVNKWYFERSRGTWKLHDSNWAMFWTTPGVPEENPVKFKDYEAVCRNIQPSWADKKSVVD